MAKQKRERPVVKVGQTWRDNDPRGPMNEFTIISKKIVVSDKIEVGPVVMVRVQRGSRKTWIREDRFTPWTKMGYTLVQDVPQTVS